MLEFVEFIVFCFLLGYQARPTQAKYLWFIMVEVENNI